MIWVAIEDVDTHEVSDFGRATEEQVLCLLDGYKVDLCNPTPYRERGMEDGQSILYSGVTYKGGYGINVIVAHKYLVL